MTNTLRPVELVADIKTDYSDEEGWILRPEDVEDLLTQDRTHAYTLLREQMNELQEYAMFPGSDKAFLKKDDILTLLDTVFNKTETK